MLRTHTCGELRKTDSGKTVTVSGWVDTRRDHGGVYFVDLRDRYGLLQVVFEPTHNAEVHTQADKLRREYVIKVTGKVRDRKEGMTNPNLATGEIELLVDSLEILSTSEVPPIEIDDRKVASEDVRLKYRYLDLRRPKMQKQFLIRHKAAQSARNYLSNLGFMEVETPLLIKSTPEGARDYIVPSRVNPGQFYSLPQSPQLYKQILMVSGFDKYFQIAKCLRDEDLRADRQPEFTQVDLEMSFVEQEDVLNVMEGMVKQMFKDAIGKEITGPIKRMTHKEAMAKYGCDKPDLRFGLELSDVTDIVKDSDFSVMKDVISKGGIVKCLAPEHDFSRKAIDKLIAFCQSHGSKGMAWMRVTEQGLESNILKYFNEDVQKRLVERTGAKPGSVMMFIADKPTRCNEIISRLRIKVAEELQLIDESKFEFVWVLDFPMFEFDEETQSYTPAHHMFTMPQNLEDIESDPANVYAYSYDLVLNGIELGSGSVRIHRTDIQERVMKAVGMTHEEAEMKFGFLLEALKYGAPPHAGMAIGLDRIVALMCGFNDIREVIAFPKNKNAQCPMDNSPSLADANMLKEVHVIVDPALKAKGQPDVLKHAPKHEEGPTEDLIDEKEQ